MTRSRLTRLLLHDATSGVLLIVAAAFALVWANTPWHGGYEAVTGLRLGPAALHLDLTIAQWASDGVLAIFFLVVGLELKHELVRGSLRDPRQAAVPMLAAVGGMAVPALIYTALALATDPAVLRGWAVPTATDIAFALAVFALFGRGLPLALRTFLLTLAVVDDLLAVIIIAIVLTASIHVFALLAALVVVALFAVVVRLRRLHVWLLIPLGLLAWGLMHASGVHATIAGVLLGLVVPARLVHDETLSRTHRIDGVVRPVANLIALPVFAFCAAGVSLVGGAGAVLAQPVVAAVVVGLAVGKPLGVLGTTALVTRVSRLRLAPDIALRDLLPIGLLAGLGFTVALLVAELSFPDGAHREGARIAVLAASVVAAGLAAVVLRTDVRRSHPVRAGTASDGHRSGEES